MQLQKGLGKWMSDRIGSGYWEKLGHALALTPEVSWSNWSFGAFRSYPLELLWATMCEPRVWPSSGVFVLASQVSFPASSQECSATLMGHCAPPTLMFHSLPHMIRYKVEFLAAASYFKATFQVSLLGFLRDPSCPGLCSSNDVSSIGQESDCALCLIFWALAMWKPISPPLSCLWGCTCLSWHQAPAPSVAELYCPVSPSSHMFLISSPRDIVILTEPAHLHLSSKPTTSQQWKMHNESVDSGSFPRTSIANALKNLFLSVAYNTGFFFWVIFILLFSERHSSCRITFEFPGS